MRNFLVITLALFIYLNSLIAQENILPPLLNGLNKNDRLLKGTPTAFLSDQYSLLVLRKVEDNWLLNDEYLLGIGKKNNKWYRLEVRAGHAFSDSTAITIKSVRLADSTGNRIWQLLQDNQLFTMLDERTEPRPTCSAAIFDAGVCVIEIVVNGQYKKLSFDTPEFYEQRCPAQVIRTRFIRCFNALNIVRYK